MFAYTGTYNGKGVTVMGSGWVYINWDLYYELFQFYGVEKLSSRFM